MHLDSLIRAGNPQRLYAQDLFNVIPDLIRNLYKFGFPLSLQE
ncbi:MAG: hypothetical protein UV59_C0012G0001, partial [Candidatus Gottesmanbacteria bacterium GW2011_GWA1_43_11]